MDIMKIYGNEYRGMEKALGHQSTRHLIHGSNIANVSTPQYKAMEYNFENALKEELSKSDNAGFLTKTNPGHIGLHSSLKPTVDKTKSGRIDGNNVDLDKEMVSLNTNETDYYSTITLLKKKMDLLQYTIQHSESGE